MALAAFFCFSLQDASVKWLVAGMAVVQVLFARSLVISLFITVRSGPTLWVTLWRSPYRPQLLIRGLLLLTAWILFYSASRHLQLAELTTIYYTSPLLVTVLSIFFLKEQVPLTRWIAAGTGFAGVLVACMPRNATHVTSIALAFFASVLWAISITLMRSMATKVSSYSQMLAQNVILLVGCGFALPWSWSPVSPESLILMLGLGAFGGLGQYLMIEAAAKVPASVMAPLEYSSLIWSFALGYLIWGDIPSANVFIGAAIIIACGLLILRSD